MTVILSNLNDNPPEISNPVFNVSETLGVGEAIGQIIATDPDNLQPLTYSLIAGCSPHFSIRAEDGVLILKERLDYEHRMYHLVTVAVTDTENTVQADATINVLPVNDEVPVFNNEAYTAAVLEEEEGILSVINVTATDRDISPQSLNYVIRQGTHMERFRINSQGEIFTTQPLDREQTPNYTLWVQANDGVNSTLK